MPVKRGFFVTIDEVYIDELNTELVGGELEALLRRAAIEWMTAEVLGPPIDKPTVTVSSTTWTGSTYKTSELFSGLHTATSVEVATDDKFTQMIYSSMNNTTDLETGTIQNMSSGNKYYIRIRYESNYYTSGWSDAVEFTYT